MVGENRRTSIEELEELPMRSLGTLKYEDESLMEFKQKPPNNIEEKSINRNSQKARASIYSKASASNSKEDEHSNVLSSSYSICSYSLYIQCVMFLVCASILAVSGNIAAIVIYVVNLGNYEKNRTLINTPVDHFPSNVTSQHAESASSGIPLIIEVAEFKFLFSLP